MRNLTKDECLYTACFQKSAQAIALSHQQRKKQGTCAVGQIRDWNLNPGCAFERGCQQVVSSPPGGNDLTWIGVLRDALRCGRHSQARGDRIELGCAR